MPQLSVNLSHDVDRVHKTYQYVTHDIFRRKFSNLRYFFSKEEPYWNFSKIIEIENKYNVRSTFFFLEESIPLRIWPPKNWFLSLGRYKFNEPEISEMIKRLDAEGWEIALHGSYRSYRNLEFIRQEKNSLEQVLGNPVIGIRQHYLNLDVPNTWKLQKEAGFFYDASYGKKKDIGYLDDKFHPFVDSTSGMFVIPLALMDRNLFYKAKNNLHEIWNLFLDLLDVAERNDAVFSILWHQRVFNEKEFPGYATIYEKIIRECKDRGANFFTCKQILERYAIHEHV